MSDIPREPQGDGEEFDLGEVEEATEGDDGDEAAEVDAGESDEGEAADDAGEEGAAEGDVEPAPRRGRETQTQRLRRQLAERDRQLAEAQGFQRALEQFRPQAPQIDPRIEAQRQQQRQERLSMMSPVEAAEFIASEKEQQVQQMLLMQGLQFEDRIDKRDYDQQARTSRVHAQYRDAVERELAQERQRGNLRASREDILHRLVGRDSVERAANAAPAQRRSAQRRVAGQQTRPTNGRGDGAVGGRRPATGSAESDEALVRQYFNQGGRL